MLGTKIPGHREAEGFNFTSFVRQGSRAHLFPCAPRQLSRPLHHSRVLQEQQSWVLALKHPLLRLQCGLYATHIHLIIARARVFPGKLDLNSAARFILQLALQRMGESAAAGGKNKP